MEILFHDKDVIVCIKPPRILSTDEPGGLPELLREELGDPKADIRTVHRLDRVVSGLMVLGCNAASASELSRQVREDVFQKQYYAVVHGKMDAGGEMTDLLTRNKSERKTYVTTQTGKDVREARLGYRTIAADAESSLVCITLYTGRTHQIRCQFSSRGFELYGDRKYSLREDPCEIALWSQSIGFVHPGTGEWMRFEKDPPTTWPWDKFLPHPVSD